MLKFREEHGTIYLYEDERLMCGYNDLALAYSVAREPGGSFEYILHKFGERQVIEAWLHDAKSRYQAAGLQAEADSLRLLASDPAHPWSVDKLNRALDTTGYVKVLVEDREAIDVVATPLAP